MYTFSRVLNCRDLDNEFFSLTSTQVPLDNKYKELIADNVDWHEFLWSDNQLRVVKTSTVQVKDGGSGGGADVENNANQQ